MKCEIIRDLFPSYIDGLTSKESNEAIEEYLNSCEDCHIIFRDMKEHIDVDKVVVNKKRNAMLVYDGRNGKVIRKAVSFTDKSVVYDLAEKGKELEIPEFED